MLEGGGEGSYHVLCEGGGSYHVLCEGEGGGQLPRTYNYRVYDRWGTVNIKLLLATLIRDYSNDRWGSRLAKELG